ncbi:molybdopterin-dependent oxidoreductase alpha subunit [Caldalkalibacillus uzonensis]|uniref:Molybdopterin-dependent oxidoreductase alpha subunit n=1 Tax=Caldalkalibacillus uzonensis TaxID=353224 RepID=A0ABU0CRD7_9BACI|nr:FdhF/YdeP family oxidoreductase [Caldalkalibacillus uzonensis]MDQ0338939.1 molybdopterin-dependent oxidoreductase alpha subunit [Caldalkalibacillus uzonensis]
MGKTKHTGPIKLDTSPTPSLWVSKVPMGLGKIKPKHIRDTLKVVWENRDNLPYAYRILTQGVCDGCALGVGGLYDQTLTGPHLCTTRLNVLRLNTMPALNPAVLEDVEALRKLDSTELRKLGRIPFPMSRKPGENKFTRLSWDEALNRIATKIRSIDPKQLAFYLTSRGITNEVYYTATKVARFLGTNNIDNASRICHSPSKTALKRSLGIAASSCSYKDWIGTDVLIFWGSVPSNNQPVSTKYMYAAKKKGTKIILINPYREPSMENYWIPSIPESALFGTKLVDDVYQVNIGGDIAFMNGVMKHWFEMEEQETGSAIDLAFVREHTNGFEELKAHVLKQDWASLEKSAGVSRERMKAFADLLAKAKSGVFVWSMGLTQHRFGTDNVSQVANLAMLRGFIGREHCGVMPIRGHSGVQGAGEMGAEPMSLPGGGPLDEENVKRMEEIWGFEIPRWPGDIVGVSLENALLPDGHERKTKLFYTSGGNFLETMPDPDFVKKCLEAVELRVHQDIILNTSTLVDAKEEVIVLPAMTRFEQPGGSTSTSTERMVYFSPEIKGPRIEEARAEWQIYIDLASRVYPEKAHLIQFKDAQAIREEIAKANPNYDGIQHLKKQGDFFQWGGAWLCEDGICPTPDGKGNLIPIEIPELRKTEGQFYVTTRRGKQFNSMIFSEKDPATGGERHDIFINPEDAKKLNIEEGEAIVVYNQFGFLQGRAKYEDVRPGNIQVYWPEGNVLLEKGVYEEFAGVPEYNVAAVVEKADTYYAHKDTRYVEKRIEDLETEVS